MSFSKAIDPDHDISDHHYYDNYTVYSYYCSNYSSIVITITTAYVHQYKNYVHMHTVLHLMYVLSCGYTVANTV